MSDYSLQVTWSTKDALATGQQLKAISATELGNEFSAIATAVATKYDADDLASQAEAEGENATGVLLTPVSLKHWSDFNAGIVGDLQALADPAAHVLFGWDNTNNAAEAFLNATNGGISIGENTVAVDLNDLATETSLVTGDFLACVDITDSGSGKITIDNLITSINSLGTIDHDAATNFVADEHVAHSGVSINAGTGLTGGGTIAATRTLTLDIDGQLTNNLGATGAIDLDVDEVAIANSTSTEKCFASALVTPEVPSPIASTTDTLAETDFGKVLQYTSTSTVTVTLPNSLKTGFWCTLLKTGATGTSDSVTATTTLNTANSLTSCTQQYGAITVFHAGSNVWYAWGALDS